MSDLLPSPGLSVWYGEHQALVERWRDLERRSDDSATAQVALLSGRPSEWLRRMWSSALGAHPTATAESLPEDIGEALDAGHSLRTADLAFLVQHSLSADLNAAVAGTRTISVLVEFHATLRAVLTPFLAEALQHRYGAVRAAAAEGLWSAEARRYASAIKLAATREPIEAVRLTMRHVAEVLANT